MPVLLGSNWSRKEKNKVLPPASPHTHPSCFPPVFSLLNNSGKPEPAKKCLQQTLGSELSSVSTPHPWLSFQWSSLRWRAGFSLHPVLIFTVETLDDGLEGAQPVPRNLRKELTLGNTHCSGMRVESSIRMLRQL
jgi:hypothetical protein